MVARLWSNRMVQLWALALALAAAPCLAAPPAAGNLDKLDTSLKLIPSDAAFYASMLRIREQASAVRHSRAWAKLRELPVVQMGLSLYSMQASTPDSIAARIDATLQNPEFRKILELATDMVSDDVFIYGEQDCVDFLGLWQDVNVSMSYGPMLLQATGQAKDRAPNQLQASMVMSALAEHADQLKFPNLLIGFKLKSTELAKEELIKLETIGNLTLESTEKTKGRFKKTKVGSYDYLTFDFDGAMVPWDELPLDKLKGMELKAGDAQKVIDHLKKMKLVVALGTRENYLLVSIGSSLKCLEKLGQGKRLIDRPELKPLAKFVGRRLTGISYASAELSGNQQKAIDNLLGLLDKMLTHAKLGDDQKLRLRKDGQGLAEDLKALLPKIGARTGLGFLSDRGFESYQYAWGDFGRVDSSKPLSLLQHVGGNPIVGLVGRGKVTGKDYDLASKWAKTVYGYFRDFGMPNLSAADREKGQKFLDAAVPLLRRLDKANRDVLLPALADGQLALVLDDKLQSKHFLETLPSTKKAMPMVEPAIVVGVSDAKLLKQGLSEYRAVVNGLIDAVRHVEGSNVPKDVQVPPPQVTQSALGTIYSFPLPKAWGVDPTIVPNVAISDKVAALSISRKHSERLLKATPLAAGGVLGKAADRPLAIAIWLDWVALVNTATPWVDFGIEQAAATRGIDDDQTKMVADQVRAVLDVLKVMRFVSCECYLEKGVLVSHSLTEIHDLPR